jgi:hypothetical protein
MEAIEEEKAMAGVVPSESSSSGGGGSEGGGVSFGLWVHLGPSAQRHNTMLTLLSNKAPGCAVGGGGASSSSRGGGGGEASSSSSSSSTAGFGYAIYVNEWETTDRQVSKKKSRRGW